MQQNVYKFKAATYDNIVSIYVPGYRVGKFVCPTWRKCVFVFKIVLIQAFMLNHARVVLQHIILTTIGDGFLNLFQANKGPCQCLCRATCSHL